MRLSRLDADEVTQLGGPEGTSAHLRTLIPQAVSVQAQVREIIARVRAEGDAAVIDYTRRFDTAGEERIIFRAPDADDWPAPAFPLSSGCPGWR